MSLVTSSNARLRAARWLVIAVSVAGMFAAAATLVLIWNASAATPLPHRISETTAVTSGLLMLAVAFVIAWRAGDQPPNVSMALALTFVFGSDIIASLLEQLRTPTPVRMPVNLLFFILGAAFYIRASQRFPRQLKPLDIASSPTIWGKVPSLRAVLIFFLRAPAVWVFVTALTLVALLTDNPYISEASRLTIVLLGLLYFYVSYRSGDVETRAKVLWFFEAALATLVFGLVYAGVRAVLHGSGSPTLSVVLSVLLYSVNFLAQVVCISAAVFYAGAVSPTLVIRKTFVYGATAALLLFIYATVEAFIVNVLVDKLGVNDRFAGAFLGTVLALTFHPIKNRMDHALRRFGSRAQQI
jgi:hypothetical protein